MYPDAVNKLSFPLPKEASHKIWLRLVKRFQLRRSLKMVDGRMGDGSGELIKSSRYTPVEMKFIMKKVLNSFASFFAHTESIGIEVSRIFSSPLSERWDKKQYASPKHIS